MLKDDYVDIPVRLIVAIMIVAFIHSCIMVSSSISYNREPLIKSDVKVIKADSTK